MVHIGLVSSFEIFLNIASRLLPDRWAELKISGGRCYFRAFQIELNTLGIKDFEIGSVVEMLQPCEVGRILVPRDEISMKFDD